ncbi:MAG: class I SAM-dependent methyltransferase [Alphaproteobacteria bacterium]|nr:class I SAM-dependent methyltransferase [Alphaproteobacteria bacterium]
MLEILSFCGLLLLFVLTLVLVILSLVFIYLTAASGFMHSSPSVPSCGKVKDAMLQSVAAELKKSTVPMSVVDLGSGWGSLLLPLAAKFPQHTFIGYEIARLPLFISRLRAHKMKNIRFVRQDILKADLSTVDIVFLFLLPSMMEKLTDKCRTEMKKSALIYSNRFKLPNIKEQQKVSLGSDYYSYYIYKM